jgi:hypothetical protein
MGKGGIEILVPDEWEMRGGRGFISVLSLQCFNTPACLCT